MKKVYIASYCRSAIGRYLGSLSESDPVKTCADVINKGMPPEWTADVEKVIVGSALSGGMGQGPARQIALAAGIPVEVPAYLISMVCGSGMQAVLSAAAEIRAEESSAVLCGGFEFMSQSGFLMNSKCRKGQKMGDMRLVDLMLQDGLTDAMNKVHMGLTAEAIAEKMGITREMQDAYADSARLKAISAVDEGKLEEEIVPVLVRQGKEWVEFRQDEFPNRTSSLEKLARLKPAFKENGTVTAGNSSGLNDGCAFLILADEAWCQRHGITPLAELVAGASAGIDPMYMGLGPVEAIGKLLRKANLRLDEVGSIELNEAFAAQAMGCMMRLEETEKIAMEALLERTNQWGSGIGLGHPLGMTGARITGTLARRMKAERSQYGIASLCIGGGMGAAVLLRGI